MAVYVDDFNAPFGRMKMSHMIADTTRELLDMVDTIGVQRKWIQYPGTANEHFDIALGKKELAIKNGAIQIGMRDYARMVNNRDPYKPNTMDTLTIEALKAMQPGTVFASGVVKNEPDGCYMTNDRQGDNLLWIARRGGIHDWAIYLHWEEMGIEYVGTNGDKVTLESNIKKLVPCTDEAYAMYRR